MSGNPRGEDPIFPGPSWASEFRVLRDAVRVGSGETPISHHELSWVSVWVPVFFAHATLGLVLRQCPSFLSWRRLFQVAL